jgi:CBS domain-containing protein
MKVKDLMVTSVKTCSPWTNLAEASSIMWNNDLGLLPIVDHNESTIGVITDRDICIAVGTRGRLASEILAGEVGAKTVFRCASDDDIGRAMEVMREGRVRRITVVDADGRLQGILSLDDLARHAQKALKGITPELSNDEVVETYRAICEREIVQASHARP